MSVRAPFIEVAALRAALAGSAGAPAGQSAARPLVLDVRWRLGESDGRGAYEAGHVPGAVFVDLDTELAGTPSPARGRHPLPEIGALQAAARRWGLHQGQPVVVYDDWGGLACSRAWWLLRWAGVADVAILDGALPAWSAQAPLETGPGEVREVSGDVVLSPGHLPTIDADQAAGWPAHGVLIDARAAARYRGEQEPVDPRAGHIPGAVNVPTGRCAPGGYLLDEPALREQLPGPCAGAPTAVYCGSGVTASHTVAVLASLGVSAALYPGSWSQWSSDPSRPAATGRR